MSLIDITPEPTFVDEYDLGDYYHAEWCDIAECDSAVSSYLVILDGERKSICQYHYATIKENN